MVSKSGDQIHTAVPEHLFFLRQTLQINYAISVKSGGTSLQMRGREGEREREREREREIFNNT